MLRALVILLVSMLAAAPGRADRPIVVHVPIRPSAIDRPEVREEPGREPKRGLFSRKSKHACLDVAQIAGAIVTDQRSIEIRMRNGERWRMGFRKDCPALSYYQGFYYRRARAGLLCAGRDTVIARSGGACQIDTIARDRKPRD